MRKLVCVCLFTIILFSLLTGINVSAADKTPASDKIFAISKGGDTSEFPAYSKEAVENCISLGFDAISVDISELSEDGDYTEKLLSLLETVNERIYVILDCTEDNIDEVSEKIISSAHYKNTFFRARGMKASELIGWAESKNNKLKIIPSYDGNVIFSAISVYDSAEEKGYDFCEFSSQNRYGVIYSEFFANRFSGTKALLSFTDMDLSGQRNDSLHGWESGIALGYSAVETTNAKEFSKYISLLDESYIHLEKVVSDAEATNLKPYSSSSTKNFLKYLDKAKEILSSDEPASQLEINECIRNIENAYSEFELSDGTEESKAIIITPMKIFWIAFAIALFLSSQIYLYKKTKKS